ncbi:hypothetical protein NQZ79_g4091 [Umbelopsis isabellina]|nr:hypothetical protein NQZ79_g4091 [Umbelopsis isabellina]
METAVELEPESYPCKWEGCRNIYNDPEQLYLHLTNDHVGRKATRNLCLTCHWVDCHVETVKRDHITSHLRVHIPLKPHHCSYCTKTFKRPQDLKKHEKTHTEEEIEAAIGRNSSLHTPTASFHPMTPPRQPNSEKSSTPNIGNQHSPLGYPISPPQSTYSEELLDSFSANHGASPYTDVTEQFASNENALEFSADDFINLHSNGTISDQHLSNKRGRSSLDATDAINELFADVLQSKRLKPNDGLKPEYGADVIDRLNTLSTFVEGIDSSAVDLNIQNEQDAAFFNEWISQLSNNIGQGDDNSLVLPLEQSPLSSIPYQDSQSPLDHLSNTSGEAASYTALFSNPELNYADLSVPGSSPYSLDQDLLNTSSSGLYPMASDSQYTRSKPTDGYNMSTIPNQVGTIGQRQHYSEAPSIAPNYFMPNMNVALNYGRSNEYGSDYASLSRKRTPHSGNKVQVTPTMDEQELPSKEEVTHERKKNVQTVLSEMSGRISPSKKFSNKFTTFINYVTPAQPDSKGTSRGISPAEETSPNAQYDQPWLAAPPDNSSSRLANESDNHLDILTQNMDKINLGEPSGSSEDTPAATSLYPRSPVETADSDVDIETRRKHLLVLQKLYQIVSSKYPNLGRQSDNVAMASPQAVPAQ